MTPSAFPCSPLSTPMLVAPSISLPLSNEQRCGPPIGSLTFSSSSSSSLAAHLPCCCFLPRVLLFLFSQSPFRLTCRLFDCDLDCDLPRTGCWLVSAPAWAPPGSLLLGRLSPTPPVPEAVAVGGRYTTLRCDSSPLAGKGKFACRLGFRGARGGCRKLWGARESRRVTSLRAVGSPGRTLYSASP